MAPTGDCSGISDVVRISNIAGRYLIFDPEGASLLRRLENTNGTLVGTTPQQPTQNVFLALPVELRSEEAHSLVRKGSAYIIDDVAAHKFALATGMRQTRKLYVNSLRQKKQAAQYAIAERVASKATSSPTAFQETNQIDTTRLSSRSGVGRHPVASNMATNTHDGRTLDNVGCLSLTPLSSNLLLSRGASERSPVVESGMTLSGYLLERRYYMTPGLRFGVQLSVYPGDPLRFHAHFMANEYKWDEPIPILDLVGGGRLATAVKKAFLIGGQQPASSSDPATVCTYSLEWAAM
ncbi:tRNA-splicing endonuclease subunit sen34 [Pochonia chlamydosporia 170]|uniref:tRNA-splicing endonuclease subunit Sen34 n=1 Tax=Pochonia chlamydosporia 170 TaxID=1380566 RepID=A0A179F9X7_METCM|nr:tRNA-splicing endonuclease subunit sen34 [Pochonia chlamydosporia 170]OAQ62256.1 tRNA-splicing endonuclease subunit sen34 [Pochonia chlamydosporia 170]